MLNKIQVIIMQHARSIVALGLAYAFNKILIIYGLNIKKKEEREKGEQRFFTLIHR